MVEVGAHQLLRAVAQNALELALGGGLHGGVDVLGGGLLLSTTVQRDQRHTLGWGRGSRRRSSPLLQLRHEEADSLGGAVEVGEGR